MVCWYPLWGLTVVSKYAFVLNRQIRLYTSSTVHLWHCYFYHSWTFWCHVCFPYCVLLSISNPPQTLHVWNIYSTYMNGFNLWYMCKGTYSIPFFGHYKTYHFYRPKTVRRNVWAPTLGVAAAASGCCGRGELFQCLCVRQGAKINGRGGENLVVAPTHIAIKYAPMYVFLLKTLHLT